MLDEYLHALGSFKSEAGQEYQVISPRFDTEHWAKVSTDTHCLYENYPHPFIAPKQITQDLKASLSKMANKIWYIAEIQQDQITGPLVEGKASVPIARSGLPTGSLLG